MKYIDKSQNTQAAIDSHQLINDYLIRCGQGGWVNHDLYDSMKSDKDPQDQNSETTYNQLRKKLHAQNDGLCCYCMRSIKIEETTLEHVIPNKTSSQEKYDEYKKYYSSGDWSKMVFTSAFLNNPRWPNSAWPHTVAYENLLPSCNGKMADPRTSKQDPDIRISKCCNNKRGEAFVIPFLLNRKMVSEFEYKPNGLVIWPVDSAITGQERKSLLMEHKKTIDNLQLNCPELVAIRRIWYFLSNNHKDCTDLEKERTLLYLAEEPDLPLAEKDMLQNFYQPNFWCLLNDYRFFNNPQVFTL